jgi:hypothetical protein
VYGRVSVRDVIPKTNLELFAAAKKTANSLKLRITDLRHDSHMFCKLYVAIQTRDGNVDDFFAHENNKYPPAISEGGQLRAAKTKSDILTCLMDYADHSPSVTSNPSQSALIIDGAALVHMLSPGTSKNFQDYCSLIVWPFVSILLKSVTRLDVVFDRYHKNSLKSQTRQSRGSGQRIHVTPTTAIPTKFSSFLTVDTNKQQLFAMIAKYLTSQATDSKVLVCTVEELAYASHENVDLSEISPCDAEEADGRMLLHADSAVK